MLGRLRRPARYIQWLAAVSRHFGLELVRLMKSRGNANQLHP